MIILGFYKYVHLKEPEKVAEDIREFCKNGNYKGSALISHEGINASISSTEKDNAKLKKFLKEIPEFNDLFFKEEETESGHPFKKLSIRLRKEIVSFSHEVDLQKTGRHISPEEFLENYDEQGNLKENILLLDARNTYEVEIGKFRGATHLNLKTFREFAEKAKQLEKHKDKKVVMYCTGGIRCEKASAYLVEQGFTDVSQINQGIINFAKEKPETVWEGKCFVFDRRMVSPINKDEGAIAKCLICKTSCDFLRNCKNLDCNKFFVSCMDCEKQYSKCCSQKCAEKYRYERRKSNKN